MTMEEAALEAVPGISLLEVLLDLVQMAPTVRKVCEVREALQTDQFSHPIRRNLFPAIKEKKEPSPIGRIRFHIRLPSVLQSPSSSQFQELVSSLSSNYGNFTVVPSTLIPRAVISRVRFFSFYSPLVFLKFLNYVFIFRFDWLVSRPEGQALQHPGRHYDGAQVPKNLFLLKLF